MVTWLPTGDGKDLITFLMIGLKTLLLAFLSIEESTATKLVSLILSVILEVIQTSEAGSQRQCWLQFLICF